MAKTNEQPVQRVDFDPVTGKVNGYFSPQTGQVRSKLNGTDELRPPGGASTNVQ